MGIIFDGREFAEKEIKRLRDEVIELEKKMGRNLKLVTIYNPENEGSRVYTDIKAKKAEELGIKFQVYQFTSYPVAQLSQLVKQLNNDDTVDGILIQMPLGTENDQELINLIDLKKDVDGLGPESEVVPATVRAVVAILEESLDIKNQKSKIKNSIQKLKVCVVGNRGLVGSRLQKELKCEGMDEEDFDPGKLINADVIVSATGMPGLIKPEMVKPGAACIDVGYPRGDFDPSTALRASFFTPVPGGVGPVTVAMLFANLMDLKKL